MVYDLILVKELSLAFSDEWNQKYSYKIFQSNYLFFSQSRPFFL